MLKKYRWLDSVLLIALGAAVLGTSILFRFGWESRSQKETLARFESDIFTPADLSPSDRRALQQVDDKREQLLALAAERWIEGKIRDAESARLGISPQSWEVHASSSVGISDEEIKTRYQQSPAANLLPYETALKKIKAELKREKGILQDHLKFSDAQERYSIWRRFPPIRSALPGTFPQYTAPAAIPEIADGRVVAAPWRGPANAPILLKLYSEFMCPYSQSFNNTLKKLDEKYPDQIRVEFHHFPLPFHKTADLQAEASVCAQEQGQFWEYHDLLFSGPGKRSADDLKKAAADLGLDQNRFDECLDTGVYRMFVQTDIREAKETGINGTPTCFLNGRMLRGALSGSKIEKVVKWLLNPEGAFPGPPPPKPRTKKIPLNGPAAARRFNFSEQDLLNSPSKGSPNAPIVIVEFMDFHCPFCRKGAHTMDELLRIYGKDVRLISKQYPLTMHPEAKGAAAAALCAGEQKKFWEYRDALFGGSWGTRGQSALTKLADELGLSGKQMGDCLNKPEILSLIDADIELAARAGIQGTPAYFINGRFISGAVPIEEFKNVIEQILKEPKEGLNPQ